MKTIEAELKLFRVFDWRQKLMVANVTNHNTLPIMFETDMVILSNSNFATGIEIKVTKSDLKNDKKKRHVLASHHPNGFRTFYGMFKYFCYAVPGELVDECEKQIDSRFGIINLTKSKYTTIHYERHPIQLFVEKWTDKQRYDLARLGTMRQYNLKKKIIKLQKEIRRH
jgi:hypothetical protein